MIPLMFHSVGCESYDFWSRSFLSASVKSFEKFCSYINSKGYKTIFLDEWYSIKSKNINNDRDKYLVLTFDDGYLDNWVYVYPILKRYKMKATIFVNPEFVDENCRGLRPKFDDRSFDAKKVKDILGFLNWDEMREMEKSQIIDVQNHTMSHNKYFSSPELINFLDETTKTRFDWLLWFKKISLKPRYMYTDVFDHIDKGYPVFENDRSLKVRRYFPDENLVSEIISRCKFYDQTKSLSRIEILRKLRGDYSVLFTNRNNGGRYETDEEMISRYLYELKISREIMHEKLGKEVNFLCWPGGEYNHFSLKLSQELGYKASNFRKNVKKKSYRKFKNAMLEKIKSKGLNSTLEDVNVAENYISIRRAGMGTSMQVKGEFLKVKSDDILIDKFDSVNSRFSKLKIISKKLFYYFKKS